MKGSRLAPLCGALALVWVGCQQVLGVDDFHSAPPSSAGSGGAKVGSSSAAGGSAELPDPGTLFDPKPPFRSLSACQECERANCAAEHAACDEDPICRGFAEDPPTSPPENYSRRYLPPLADQRWELDHGAPIANPVAAIANYNGCLQLACAAECELGRNFSCMGKFDWPRTEAGDKTRRYVLFDETQASTDWDLHLCLSLSCTDNNAYYAHTTTDELGFAELAFDPGRLLYESVGYVLVEDRRGDHYPAILNLGPAPLVSGYYDGFAIFTKALIDEPFIDLGAEVLEDADPSQGTIWAFVKDCTGLAARHLTVEVLTANEAGRGYGPCPDCRTVYNVEGGLYGLPDPGPNELNTIDGRAIIINVPRRHALLVARDVQTRRAVAVQHLVVHGDYAITYVPMYPASQTELEQLPNELR